jgi:hypothetical protein
MSGDPATRAAVGAAHKALCELDRILQVSMDHRRAFSCTAVVRMGGDTPVTQEVDQLDASRTPCPAEVIVLQAPRSHLLMVTFVGCSAAPTAGFEWHDVLCAEQSLVDVTIAAIQPHKKSTAL